LNFAIECLPPARREPSIRRAIVDARHAYLAALRRVERGSTICGCSAAWPSTRADRVPGRRQGVQPDDLGHRRRARTSCAPQPQHKTSDRCERMAVNGADIDRAACPAAGAENVRPWRSRGDGGRIVGDHSAPLPAASAAFQRSTTRCASSCAALASDRARHVACMSGRRVRFPISVIVTDRLGGINFRRKMQVLGARKV
jgi:hypothetical protein